MARRFWIGMAVATVALIVVLTFVFVPRDPLRAPARRAWMASAIDRIERQLADNASLDAERARLQRGDWVGDDLLVMRDGSWIACRNVCNKEQGDIADLFVGRGSDGGWYYSTFHFCVGKCVLQVDSRPASLASFVHGYYLQPFEGHPDHPLARTWSNEPNYGDVRTTAPTSSP